MLRFAQFQKYAIGLEAVMIAFQGGKVQKRVCVSYNKYYQDEHLLNSDIA